MSSSSTKNWCRFLLSSLLLTCCSALHAQENAANASPKQIPNVLLITVDDMSCDSVGAFGCRLEGTTPTMDQLAKESLSFRHAHVQVGNCMPGRNVLFSGRYSHSNGVEGFRQVKQVDYPVLSELMQDLGYFAAIRGKVNHSTPYQPFSWDAVLQKNADGSEAHIKDPLSYGHSTREGIRLAQEAEKPFYLVVNVSDPHKPFYTQGRRGKKEKDPFVPSRVFTADEVPVPGFLFDDPAVREELALYYSSVRRADDCVREILKALDDSGMRDNTLVMFLSDHGMPFPFAKTQLYHHSTHTPWMIRWPGVVRANSEDTQHMISSVDLVPTMMELVDGAMPDGLEGKSFASLLTGGTQAGRDFVIKEYNEAAGGDRSPMRAVQTKQFLYLYNPWSNGKKIMRTATTGTATFRRMKQLAESDEALAARLALFQHRVPEELYDVQRDPDCLHNLIDEPDYQEVLGDLRETLRAWSVRTNDHQPIK